MSSSRAPWTSWTRAPLSPTRTRITAVTVTPALGHLSLRTITLAARVLCLSTLKIARADSQLASGGQHHGGSGAGQSHEGHHGNQQCASSHRPATPPSLYGRSSSPRPQQQFPGSTHPAHRGEHNRPHPMNERRAELGQSGDQNHGVHHSGQQGGQQGGHRPATPPSSSYHHLGSPLLQPQHLGSTCSAHQDEHKRPHPVNERRAEQAQSGGQHHGGQTHGGQEGGQQGGQHQAGQRPETLSYHGQQGGLSPAHQGGHHRTPSLKERSSVWDWEMDLD
ncbi:hypothetical protein DAEQUDRAFT_720789 [Daedalea quercina L-15889]|uniref:Uncharacterized protein n=1 Tax=Daedalea quercina L-15889 TaxID=1314783 RepID=A0A165U9N4_9APHY|nr:hypothetical protein DAEQUDRAFT_720789 [Daedalea quercina L-15889]